MEFAPSLDLFFVPSSSTNILSMVFCSLTSIPLIVSLISVFMKLIDLRTPFEKNLFLSLSLNSIASWTPVEAPLGTDALPKELSSKKYKSKN